MFGFGKKKKAAKENAANKSRNGQGVGKSNQMDRSEAGTKARMTRKEKELINSMDPTQYINAKELENMRDILITGYAPLVIRGMLDPDARTELAAVIRVELRDQTHGKEFLVKYITRETVGTGVIEDILENDPSITDIGYNGTDLIVESNDRKYIYTSDDNVDDAYIIRLINKFAHANKRDFTQKNPIFDGKFENVRINAMYNTNTTSGVTMSLRIVRPQLALREDSFFTFAPQYIYDLFKSMVEVKANFVISGETGTGKTELQKMMAGFIPFSQRIVLIEDVAETFLKEMFADKDIYSWITSPDITITDLVKASLRNNPRWILISETRGLEAYEMIQAVLSGHHIITTLHAVNAGAIPTRLINMAKMGYTFDEHGLKQDILRYFDFGVHIIRDEYKGKTIRYLNELIYFDEFQNTTIFRQDYVNGKFICQVNDLPDVWLRLLNRENKLPKTFKKHTMHDRNATVEKLVDEKGKDYLELSVAMGKPLKLDDLKKLLPIEEIIVYGDPIIERDLAGRVLSVTSPISHTTPLNKSTLERPSDVRQPIIDPNEPVFDVSQPRESALNVPIKTAAVKAKPSAQARLADMKSKPNRQPTKARVKPKAPEQTTGEVQTQAEALLARYKQTASPVKTKQRA